MWHILATICFRGFSHPVHHLNIIKTAIHKTNAEIWSLTVKEEDRLRVYEKGVLRRTSEPNSKDVKARQRKLHNGGFQDLHNSPNTIRVIKTRRMRWAGHVAYRRKNIHTRFWWVNLKI